MRAAREQHLAMGTPVGLHVPVLHRYHCHTAQVSRPYPCVTLCRSHSTTGATTVSVRQQRYSHSPLRVTPYRSCRLPVSPHSSATGPLSRVQAPQPHGAGPIRCDSGASSHSCPTAPKPRSRRPPAASRERTAISAARKGHARQRGDGTQRKCHARRRGPGTRRRGHARGGKHHPRRLDPRSPRSDLQRRPRAGRAASGYIASTGGAGPRVASNQRRRRRVQPHVASNQRRHRFRPMRCVQSAAAPPRRGGRKRGTGGSGAHGGRRGGSRR